MTTISGTTLNLYPSSPLKATIREPEDKATSALAPVDDSAEQSDEASTKPSKVTGDLAATSSTSYVEQLKKQIEQAQKLLAQQQAQLQSVERGQASDEQKAQQAMAIQTQIMGTSASLQTLQSALLQAMSGSVDTHA